MGNDSWLEEDTVRCKHRPWRDAPPCNIELYVLASWHARDDSVDLVYAVEVTREEVQQMRRRKMTTAQRLMYLGIVWAEALPPLSAA